MIWDICQPTICCLALLSSSLICLSSCRASRASGSSTHMSIIKSGVQEEEQLKDQVVKREISFASLNTYQLSRERKSPMHQFGLSKLWQEQFLVLQEYDQYWQDNVYSWTWYRIQNRMCECRPEKIKISLSPMCLFLHNKCTIGCYQQSAGTTVSYFTTKHYNTMSISHLITFHW